jgi:hypothetical protein
MEFYSYEVCKRAHNRYVLSAGSLSETTQQIFMKFIILGGGGDSQKIVWQI